MADMIARKEVEVDRLSVSRFELVNGHSPKGWGQYGFQFADEQEFFIGTFAEAKRQAVKHAAERGVYHIYLLA